MANCLSKQDGKKKFGEFTIQDNTKVANWGIKVW